MIKHHFLPAVLCFCASTALGAQEITCTFISECIDTEACEDSSYTISITHKDFAHPQDGMDASAVWTDDAVTRNVLLRSRPDIVFAMWAEHDGRQFGRLMTDGAGQARYVVMDSTTPLMISYHGTCKDAE
ncbi:hypothetical protein OS189_03975 [Sulfitobacter sp. F26169L]|uniref:hypothetical protein n=1 Tax=Sulfitobacter sp. F26169L TaxID=2996015 RepID=UPI002260FAC2|nr:hypothetical protein [Sulfitobacter sp. F26169L]MCX7565502.1 hypothetical protein [Sulfitobacter sp. F26169L]